MTLNEDPIGKLDRERRQRLAVRQAEHQSVVASPEYTTELVWSKRALNDYLFALHSCLIYGTRVPDFTDRSLVMRTVNDFLESGVSVAHSLEVGLRNPARRELRYSLELAVQTLLVDQKMTRSSVDDRLTYMRAKVKTSDLVGSLKQIELGMLSEARRADFMACATRAWSTASEYAHPTPAQILERIELEELGVTPGFETATELRSVNDAAFEIWPDLQTLGSPGSPLAGLAGRGPRPIQIRHDGNRASVMRI